MATPDTTPRGPALGLDAALAVAGLSPLLAARAGWAKRQTGRIFDSAERIGQNRQPFQRLYFAGDGAGVGGAVLFNLLRGDMAWVGPAPLAPDEAGRLAPEFKRRFTLRPGLISPLGARKAVGIAYEDALADEMIFFFGQRPGSKFGLAARFLIARLLAGGNPGPCPNNWISSASPSPTPAWTKRWTGSSAGSGITGRPLWPL
jgi:N-acetylglucosaminyldiphosphoundecaprenol N-acetyl-beta-D-mannosaminyltransferase